MTRQTKRELLLLGISVPVVYVAFAALAYGAYSIIASVPGTIWQVAWVMARGAVPFGIILVIALWLNQRSER